MWRKIYIAFLVVAFLGCKESSEIAKAMPEAENFAILEYNNPGLIVDVGVGLWAWPLPMDYDGDGDMDLVVACPDTPYNGTYLFENKTDNTHSNTVFEKPVRLGKGIENIRLYKDPETGESLVLGPGIVYENFKDSLYKDVKPIYPRENLEKHHEKRRFSQWNFVDYEDDGDLDLIVGMDDWKGYGWDNAFDQDGNWTNDDLHGYVYLITNENGSYSEPKRIQAAGADIDVYGLPSPNMKDFDNDGDLDLILGEFLDRFTYFENIGTRSSPKFSEGRFLENPNGVLKMDLEMIVPTAVDWDGDGDIDLIVGDEDGRVAYVENTGRMYKGIPEFKDPVYVKQKADVVKFGALITPYGVDWDNDGDEDIIAGNTAGYIGFIENLDGGNPPKWNEPQYLTVDNDTIRYMAGPNGSIQGPAEAKWGYTTLSVTDWDGDGLHDIIVNSIWGKVQWHKNVGTEGKPKLSAAKAVTVDWSDVDTIPKPKWNWWEPGPTELSTQWRTTPFTVDWNKDGMMDLVMLDHEGYLTFYERFEENGSLKLKHGNRIFYGLNASKFTNKNKPLNKDEGPLQLNAGEAGHSGRVKLTFTDWDNDGDLDILINSQNASLLENVRTEGDITYFKHTGDLSTHKIAGHTTSPTTVDWDNDGVRDLLVGAEDGHLYYLENPHK